MQLSRTHLLSLLLLVFPLLACNVLSNLNDEDFNSEGFNAFEENDPTVLLGNEIDEDETASSEGVAGEFAIVPCPIDVPNSYDVECGYLTVPENRTSGSNRIIELAVAIMYAPNQNEASVTPPVVYLTGGPGGSALDDFSSDPEGWDYSFLQTRDLILLDQRGTGHSRPTLDCPEFQSADEDEDPDELCYERLDGQGIDFSAYNTRENAADVADLRIALGYAEWDILGISYGTRLALEVMELDPAGIRSVILDSPFPRNADTPVDEVYTFTDAFDQLLADCEQDDYCSETYPDLEDVFLETVERLNEDESAEIFGDDLVFAVNSAFDKVEPISLIPYVIYEVADDNFDALFEIVDEEHFAGFAPKYQSEDFSDSEGMYNAVICFDEYRDGDYERVESEVIGEIPEPLESALLQPTFQLTELCTYWNPRDSVDNSPVVSDIPTLVLVGQYDVATPPRWAILTAQTLSNSYLFEFPGAGHSLISTLECTVMIMDDFLANPQDRPSDACADFIDWPYFE